MDSDVNNPTFERDKAYLETEKMQEKMQNFNANKSKGFDNI